MSDVILDTTDYVDRTMRITCLVPSTEKPFTIQKIAWKKINKTHESAEIGTDSKYVMQRDPPSLLIRNIDENDTGKYVCCISCNTEERICSIVIESPTITCEVSQLYELPGKELALKYFIDSDFRVKTNLLKANKGTEVNMLLKEVTHKSINYTIDSASFDDAGTYICRVSNALGTDTASRILVIGDRPEIICERLPYIVPEGHDITLECEVKSKLPLLKLFWERNDVTIDPNDGSGRYKNGNIEVPSLTLNYVSQSDQGNYICYASNVYGIAQSSILEVEIAGPPRITTKCQTYMVYAGDEVNLQCEVASIIPIKKLFWKKNEESVEKTDKYGDATVDFPSLFIKKTEMSDEGDYICCACNDAGMSTSNLIKLIIKDIDLNKTYPPSNDKVKGDHTGADFNNSWHGPYYIGKGNNTGLVAQVALDKFEAKIARERSKKFIDEELRVVLIGKTGAGKSATCNTISGKNLFESKFGAMSITKKTESKRVEVCDKQILLIDTPGIFDYGEIENEKEIEKEISQCVVLGSPGIHAILFVMPLGSRTNESIKVIHTFLEYFGHEMKEHVIVIFTFGDALEKKKMDIKDYLKGAPKDILDFLQQCGNRYVVFNNELESFQNSVQVQCLINLISRHKYEKALCYYTDNIFDAAEKDLKQKEDEIQKKLEDLYQRRVEEFNNAFEKMSERVVTCLKSGVKGDIEKYKRQIEEMQTQSRKEIDELRAKYEDRLSRVRDEARSELKDKPTLFTLRRKSATYDVKK